MKHYFVLAAIWVAFLWVVGGCASAPNAVRTESVSPPSVTNQDAVAMEGEESADSDRDEYGGSATDTVTTSPADRVIIRSADLRLIVEDPSKTLELIRQQAQNEGGWVVSSNIYRYDSSSNEEATITVRIPAEKFYLFLEATKVQSVRVIAFNESGEDVTNQFVDLNSRLKTLRATEERLLTFLAETKKMQDALELSRELERLQTEIELLQGQIKYLSESADFSAITITLTREPLSQPITPNIWQPSGTAKRAIETLLNFLQAFVDLLIWFTIVWLPFLLIFAVILWILRWMWRKVRRR